MVTRTSTTSSVGSFHPNLAIRKARGLLVVTCGVLSVVIGLATLFLLIADVLGRGLPWLDWQFLSSFDSRFAARAGIKAALYGTAMMICFTMLIALPLGVMAAIYLEEYAGDNWFTQVVQLNIANLAGVPSIIYGLLGLALFVRAMGMGRSVLAGSMTMALLVLPVIIVATREAIRAVPAGIRQASYAVGATRSQTIWHHVLPYALPGILTGNILAASRAIGETAPLITIGALTYVPFTPRDPFDRFTALPILIFNWTSKPQATFHDIAAAAILVLLALLLAMNAIAITLRQRVRRKAGRR
ncbi:MAG: phosphate ABC transporter permease PstA [Dehalococcoidia bacterium]